MQKERVKISEHLYLDEVIDLKTYYHYARQNLLYKLVYRIDRNLVFAFEELRSELGGHSITINNWWKTLNDNNWDLDKTYKEVEANNNLYQWSGFRPTHSPYWTPNSMHGFYKAWDLKWFDVKLVKKAQDFVKKYWNVYGLGGLEIKKGWVHMDTRFLKDNETLKIF